MGLIKTINKMESFTINIQINHFDNEHYTAQGDHFDITQNDGQA